MDCPKLDWPKSALTSEAWGPEGSGTRVSELEGPKQRTTPTTRRFRMCFKVFFRCSQGHIGCFVSVCLSQVQIRLCFAMTDLSEVMYPFPVENLGVLMVAWNSGPQDAAPRAIELLRQTPAFQSLNPSLVEPLKSTCSQCDIVLVDKDVVQTQALCCAPQSRRVRRAKPDSVHVGASHRRAQR